MSPKRTYFGFSTGQQRKLLFEVWEKTQSIENACAQARVSQGTFYYWKVRFEEKGYAGLEAFRSREAHKLNRKDAWIEKAVVDMRKENPDWGKARIAHEMAKANHWVSVVSPNTVKRILEDAGEWPESAAGGKIRRKRSSNG
jgi:transposase